MLASREMRTLGEEALWCLFFLPKNIKMFASGILNYKEEDIMITIKDFTVGQPCYVVEKKYGKVKNLEIKEAVVKKVGRKYVTANCPWELKYENFNADYLMEVTSYGSSSYLFPSKKAAEEYVEKEELIRFLNRLDSYHYERCSLEDLQKIMEILKKYNLFS